MFTRILIANRGEVAVRVIRACKEMGIFTIAVYADVDRESMHVALADQAICIGSAKAEDSYLDMNRVLSAALATKAQAIHPGYGFLSENAAFAELCERYGITFIGPGAQVIAKLGDKDTARRMMRANGVPTTPGTDILPDAEAAKKAAREIGYPILLKASAGGGGKGIRLVKAEADMTHAFDTASNEARRAFGDGRMYMEKYLDPVKHIEVQILADEQGNTICLGERECSIQQNNQKLVEESPSPGVSPETRAKLTEIATRAAKAAGYVNAGTVEFLMDQAGDVYFMEMNTRLQVEHPVTELVTGLDIVKWQIRIAAGVSLDLRQEDIQVTGAALECRINAKAAGNIDFLIVPSGPWVRLDTFLYQGYRVLPYYDSMLGKLVVYSSSREEAIRKMQSALCELVIEGTPNNIEEQLDIIRDPRFKQGDYYTDFMKNRS